MFDGVADCSSWKFEFQWRSGWLSEHGKLSESTRTMCQEIGTSWTKETMRTARTAQGRAEQTLHRRTRCHVIFWICTRSDGDAFDAVHSGSLMPVFADQFWNDMLMCISQHQLAGTRFQWPCCEQNNRLCRKKYTCSKNAQAPMKCMRVCLHFCTWTESACSDSVFSCAHMLQFLGNQFNQAPCNDGLMMKFSRMVWKHLPLRQNVVSQNVVAWLN